MAFANVRSGRLFPLLLLLTLAFRFWLSAVMPITGDEAYFIEWGRRPDWGFYDHPPMVGWILAALLHWSDAEWWLRLPATLLPAVLALSVGWALPRLWPDVDRERATWAALLVLLAPVNVWNVLITTDTPLIYFSVFSGLAWLKAAEEDDAWGWYFVSGLFLAGAVLCKYFVALLGFAYLVDVVLRGGKRAWAGLAIAYACCLPALGLMAWWNSGHCWVNYMFNFVTRNEDAGLSWQTPLLYVAILAYVLTPPVLWLLVARGGGTLTRGCRTAVTLSLVPFSLFALLSLAKSIGLHWVLSFVAFAFLPLARRLSLPALRRLGLFFVGFAALHVAAIVVISRLPLETWRRTHIYDGIVLTFETNALLDVLRPYENDYVFASDGYSNADTYGYALQRQGGSRFIVFGAGSYHGRQDDMDTDFRTLAGKNILVLRKTLEPKLEDYRPFFHHVEIKTFLLRGVRFWLVLGQGFDYPAYRERVLADVRHKYYAVPSWLPMRGCFICDRYFEGKGCTR